ncbi:MAG: DUF268 domain-containing protein [Acidimicrobiales bacterium]|nr:DUF268 domain-containing protein [Acidimicrobiales bacterium]
MTGKLAQMHEDLNSGFVSISEEAAILAMQIRSVRDNFSSQTELTQAAIDEVRAIRFELAQHRAEMADTLAHLAPSVRLKSLQEGSVGIDQVDESAAAFLNYAASHRGPLAEKNLWINNPVVVEWLEGNARIGAVNERIMEVPYVLQSLAPLPPGSAVLDIGGGESTLGFSLASLGYRTTVIEPQGYPFEHPNLEVLLHPLEDLPPGRTFDAVVLLSTIEHFGIGHYSGGPEPDEDADLAAMKLVAKLLSPNGLLSLTVPYGPAEVNELERIYDLERLQRLLEGWDILDARIGRRADATTWVLESNELSSPSGPGRVAMLTARPRQS